MSAINEESEVNEVGKTTIATATVPLTEVKLANTNVRVSLIFNEIENVKTRVNPSQDFVIEELGKMAVAMSYSKTYPTLLLKQGCRCKKLLVYINHDDGKT